MTATVTRIPPTTPGFKSTPTTRVEQELTKIEKAGEGAWTVPSRLGFSIKPSELATAFCTASDLLGGRPLQISNTMDATTHHDSRDRQPLHYTTIEMYNCTFNVQMYIAVNGGGRVAE